MLQQTTVTAVIPYYESFLRSFPSVQALAAAPVEAVMAAWAGLGYYARARNLHRCAQTVAAAGGFPADVEGLRALPGIGPYTATAIGAIAFGIPGIPVDGNVERVLSRVFAITDPLPTGKPAIRAAALSLGRDKHAIARPSDFAQALFDLGASLCTPTTPACGQCPWTKGCAARLRGIASDLPRREKNPERPHRHGVHFWLTDAGENVLLRRRPPTGLLGGMTELPGTAWRDTSYKPAEALRLAPMEATWRKAGTVHHGFTHFTLDITVYAARVPRITADGFSCSIAALDAEALPSVMRKCVRLIMAGEPSTIGPTRLRRKK
jgi:A/G-specific adenine glycosylase